jgi:hypothetical protein
MKQIFVSEELPKKNSDQPAYFQFNIS